MIIKKMASRKEEMGELSSLLNGELTPNQRFLIEREPKSRNSLKYFCSKCKKAISEKVAKFCLQNKSKFGGRAYCFDCQKDF